jgi:hypothetical protein
MGFFSITSAHDAGNTQSNYCIGMMSDNGTIVQRELGARAQSSQADGENHGLLTNTQVAHIHGNATVALSSVALTANDATNSTFTNSGNTLAGDLIGLLVYADDVEAQLVDITSPNSAGSNWTVTGAGFTPQFVLMALSELVTINSGVTDNATAGSFGIAAVGASVTACISVANEQGANPTDVASRLSTNIYLMDDDNTADYTLASAGELSFNSDGFTVSSADIDLADGTSHSWFGLFVAAPASAEATLEADYSGIVRGAWRGAGRGL